MSKFNAAFWKWFGDSKVVDKNGDPLVVYHRTDKKFSIFDPDKAATELGMHFGTKQQIEDIPGEYVYSVFLKILKPLYLNDPGEWHVENMLEMMQFDTEVDDKIWSAWDSNGDLAGTKEVRKQLQKQGFDGVIYLNRRELGVGVDNANRTKHLNAVDELARSRFKVDEARDLSDEQFLKIVPNAEYSYIVWNANQIKSVDNDGTWDAGDPDIRSNPEDFGESEDIFSDEWMKRLELAISQSVAKILNDAGDSYVVHLKRKDGSQLFVSQTSNSGKNAYQVSWVDKNDIPSMDTLFKTREAALISIAGGGSSPSIGQPGEWKVVATRKRK